MGRISREPKTEYAPSQKRLGELSLSCQAAMIIGAYEAENTPLGQTFEEAFATVSSFRYRGKEACLGWQTRRSLLKQWRKDFERQDLAGVVWGDVATSREYQEPSEKDQKMAAKICNFETPSEKAGLILHCPAEQEEDNISNQEVVELHVGSENEVIHVSKILCKKIPYFSKMFEGSFQEATSNSASFPEDEVDAFHALIYWVNNGYLPPWIIYLDANGDDTDRKVSSASVRVQVGFDFVGLYVLADKFCAFNLMNFITDYVIRSLELNESVLPIEDISEIYANAPANTGLRRLACYSFYYSVKSCSQTNWPTKDLASLLQTDDGLAIDFIDLMRSRPDHGGITMVEFATERSSKKSHQA
ncbi:hypothetical protein SBOR_2910 [Sclerotinia borealis F-4128]|uniref:BTB domain-containing protein n=1 Tax=Sclerotinia borealis (strain F-4128) TaxID=1432307 RepID=W9CQC5_SCLBF|nr:hypothetical protein SBOR_2910 [Sclerotinia borealis F-4128]